jgi:hypothetical protein
LAFPLVTCLFAFLELVDCVHDAGDAASVLLVEEALLLGSLQPRHARPRINTRVEAVFKQGWGLFLQAAPTASL